MKNARKTYLTPGRIIAALIVGSIVLVLAPMVLYPFRNVKPESVAERFLRSNSEIGAESGDITRVGKLETRSRSEEIALRLRTGESLTNIANSNTPVARQPDDVVRLPMSVTGSKREVEAQVALEKAYFGEYDYVVTGLQYRNGNGDLIDVPVGTFENYCLLFK